MSEEQNKMTRWIFIVAAVIAALAAVAPQARAADYPQRAIRLVVPYPPGGGTDVMARRLADEMGKGLGQRVVVENVGGAGGNIGMLQAARAAPDAYTLVLGLTAQFAVNKNLYANLPYDPLKDFEPIALLAVAPYVLVVHPSLPVRNINELFALANKEPGKLTYASAGNGSGAHLSAELLKSMAGINMVHVPYKGAGAAYTDLLAGRIQLMFSTYAPIAGYLNSGMLRAIAVSTDKRAAWLPDVPAIAEMLQGYRSDVWYVLAAPAGTPPDLIARLNKEALIALKSPVIEKAFSDDLIQPVGSRPDAVKPFIAAEIVKWGDVVKKSGAHIE
jgi:tripartite-type tricarboxylate transporter receptor subunit TctC